MRVGSALTCATKPASTAPLVPTRAKYGCADPLTFVNVPPMRVCPSAWTASVRTHALGPLPAGKLDSTVTHCADTAVAKASRIASPSPGPPPLRGVVGLICKHEQAIV